MIRLLRSDLGRARVLLGVVIVAASLLTVELVREAVAVHRLTRGVGDTWFHAADGRRWFRLDAERHDVPIAAIAPSLPDSGVDAYVGIGGSPEAVISAAAIKCLGGQQLCRMWPKDDKEREHLLGGGLCIEADLKRVWTVEMMAPGDHVIFAATGISDSPMW